MAVTRWVVLVAAVTSLASAQVSAQAVSRKYDRFKDRSVFTLPTIDLPEHVKMSGIYICVGDVPSCRPDAVYLVFQQANDEWEHLDSHPFTFLVDGKDRMDMGDSGYDGSVGSGDVFEIQDVRLTQEQMAKLANASKIEAQWTSTEFTLTPEALNAIRIFAKSAEAK